MRLGRIGVALLSRRRGNGERQPLRLRPLLTRCVIVEPVNRSVIIDLQKHLLSREIRAVAIRNKARELIDRQRLQNARDRWRRL